MLALARFSVGGVELSWAVVVTAAVFLLWLVLDLAIGVAMALFLVPALTNPEPE